MVRLWRIQVPQSQKYGGTGPWDTSAGVAPFLPAPTTTSTPSCTNSCSWPPDDVRVGSCRLSQKDFLRRCSGCVECADLSLLFSIFALHDVIRPVGHEQRRDAELELSEPLNSSPVKYVLEMARLAIRKNQGTVYVCSAFGLRGGYRFAWPERRPGVGESG